MQKGKKLEKRKIYLEVEELNYGRAREDVELNTVFALQSLIW